MPVVQQVDGRPRAVLVILLRTEGEIGAVADQDLSARLAEIIGTVLLVGTRTVIKCRIERIEIRSKGAQTEIGGGRGITLRSKAGGGDVAGQRRLVLRQLMGGTDGDGDILMSVGGIADDLGRIAGIAHRSRRDDGSTLIHFFIGGGIGFHGKQVIFQSFQGCFSFQIGQ